MFEYGKSIKIIHKKLHEIPTALNDVYANILNLIEIEDRPQTLKLMQWVCFARRPLSIMELRYAMMVDDDVIGERFDGDCTTVEAHAKTEKNMKRKVKGLSGGLIEFKKNHTRTRGVMGDQ